MSLRADLRALPRAVWVQCIATFVNRAGTMVLPFLLLYLTRDMGLSPSTAGAIVALYGATALVTSPFAGRLCDRVGPIRLMTASLLLSGLVLLVFPVARTPASVAVVRRETGGWTWPALQFTYMGVLAWVGAFVAFRVVTALMA